MSDRTRYIDGDSGPFYVDDGTGAAYVDPNGAELILTSGEEITVRGGEKPPAHVREFLERETDLDPECRHRRRYKEHRIDEGGPALVAGQADPEPRDDLEETVTTAITEAGDAPKFYVTDDPDRDLRRRLLGEALTSFLLGGLLLGIAYFILYS